MFSESANVEIVDTLGLDVHHHFNLIGGAVQPVANENGRASSGYALFYGNDPAKIDAEKTALEAAKEAVDGLSAESVPSGAYRDVYKRQVKA